MSNTYNQPVAKDDRHHVGNHYVDVSAIYELSEVFGCKTMNTVKFTTMQTLAGLARLYAKRGHSVELADGGKVWIGNSALYINWTDNDDALPNGIYIRCIGFDDGINCISALIKSSK